MLQILRLCCHLGFRQCHRVDRLTVRISHHWLVEQTALIEPVLLDPEVESLREGGRKSLSALKPLRLDLQGSVLQPHSH